MPARSEGTVLYARSGKGEVQVDKSYRTYVSENRAAFARSPAEKGTAGVVEASQGKRGELYTGKQLETADRFARYIRGSGNLLDAGRQAETARIRSGAAPGPPGDERMKGVLAAAMDIKAEVFYDSVKASSVNMSSRGGGRQSGGLFAEVRDMVGRMVDRYLVWEEAPAATGDSAPLSWSILKAPKPSRPTAPTSTVIRTPRKTFLPVFLPVFIDLLTHSHLSADCSCQDRRRRSRPLPPERWWTLRHR